MIETHDSPDKAPRPQRPGGAASEKGQREKIQKQLDEALADSFPASDPVSIVTSHEEEDWGQPESK
ncbi:MAG TPA: hypothetical protein VHV80_02475 [Steroidobacteraceae bacterium]|jgi:hypothetical protein|nr:hypothetical protein [Steroidobacteraceae bacterium]